MWQWPFKVIAKVGEVNYNVRQPGKRKGEQIYHVSLLKIAWKRGIVRLYSPQRAGGASLRWSAVWFQPFPSPTARKGASRWQPRCVFSPPWLHWPSRAWDTHPAGKNSTPKAIPDTRGSQETDPGGGKEDVEVEGDRKVPECLVQPHRPDRQAGWNGTFL